jgi:hypothetical protein
MQTNKEIDNEKYHRWTDRWKMDLFSERKASVN